MVRQEGHTIIGKITSGEFLFLVASFFAALVLRELIYVRLFPDSIDYLSFAQNILSGTHHVGDITIARYRRPPLYPHLIALFSFGRASPAFLVEMGRQVSAFAGALLVFPLYFLGRGMFNKTAAAAAAFCLVITPEFLYYSGAVLTESLSTLFVVTSMLILWLICSKKTGNFLPLLLGFSLSLAFLTRHLAIGYVAISLVWLIVSRFIAHSSQGTRGLIRKVGMQLLLVLAGFFLTISPQVYYLHSETGKWVLAMDPMSISSKNVAKSGGDIRYTTEYEAAASLTPDAERYLWEREVSPGLVSTIANDPGRYTRAYIATLFRGYLPDTCPLPYPTVILFLVLLGIIGLGREKKFAELLFCLWGFAGYYLFLALFLNIRDRYMFLAYPFLLLVAGAGMATAIGIATHFARHGNEKTRMRWVATIFLFGLTSAIVFPTSMALIKRQNALANTEHFERLGLDLSKKIEKGAVMFDRTPHLAYFSGGITASPPYAEIEDVLHFARKRGVDYWIVSSSYIPRLRPQFYSLLDPSKSHKGLIPVKVFKGKKDYIIVVYRILPE